MPRNKSFSRDNVELSPVATALATIYEGVAAHGLGANTLSELEGSVTPVARHFGISPVGAVLLSAIAERDGRNGTKDEDLSLFVGCTNIEFIGFRKDLQQMEERGVVCRAGRGFYDNNLFLTREAMRSLETGSEFSPRKTTGLDADEFFTLVRIYVSDFKREVISPERLSTLMGSLISGNPQLLYCRKVIESGLLENASSTELRIFVYLGHRLVTHGETSFPLERLSDLMGTMEDDSVLRRRISRERTFLQREGLLTFGSEDCLRDKDSIALSDEVVKTFFGEVTLELRDERRSRDVIPAEEITPKELFYNPREAAQMERLAGLLDPEHFRGVQERLSEMGMRRGFAVLFSGGAGCGKTAGVYELARRTGRDVFLVDMSSLKSKWVGESEKQVKELFDTYKRMCRTRKVAPILLFNEADAIFTKRLKDPSSSSEQMLNSLQNICLDAMESLEGILIATTNLASNFCDEAFARRFIYKVEFSTPEPSTREKIWRSMLPTLSGEEASSLARDYSFSGGLIENVTRKAAVEYVLSGERPDMGTIRRFCDEESVSGTGGPVRKIGF